MDTTITSLFNDYQSLTNSPEAAATLVLAQVQSNQKVSRQISPPPGQCAFLTVKQAAKQYALGERTVYRMVEEGLPVTRIGKAIRIKPRDLARHLADSETILH